MRVEQSNTNFTKRRFLVKILSLMEYIFSDCDRIDVFILKFTGWVHNNARLSKRFILKYRLTHLNL